MVVTVEFLGKQQPPPSYFFFKIKDETSQPPPDHPMPPDHRIERAANFLEENKLVPVLLGVCLLPEVIHYTTFLAYWETKNYSLLVYCRAIHEPLIENDKTRRRKKGKNQRRAIFDEQDTPR